MQMGCESEASIKELYQRMYDERVRTMSEVFKMELESLRKTIEQSYVKVLNDQMLQTYAKDKTTAPFIGERIKQIYSEIVQNERELIIQNQGVQLSKLRAELINHQYRLSAIRSQKNEHLQNTSKVTESYTFTLNEKQKLVYELKLQLKDKDILIKELKQGNEGLLTKLEEFQSIQMQISSQVAVVGQKEKEFEKQKKRLVKQNEQVRAQLMQWKQNQEELGKVMEKKYKKKIQEYRNKIDELKSALSSNGRLITNNSEIQTSLLEKEKILREMESRMERNLEQKNRKIQEVKSLAQRDKVQTQKKAELRIKQLQSYYQEALENKIKEVEINAQNYIQKWEVESERLNQQLLQYQNCFMPIEQHEQIVKNRQNQLIQVQQILEQKQAQLNQLVGVDQECNKYLNIVKQYEFENHQLNEKGKSLQQHLKSLTVQQKNLQQQLRDNQQYIQGQKQRYQQLVKKLTVLQVQHSNACQSLNKLQAEKENWQNHIKNLQVQNQKLNQEHKELMSREMEARAEAKQLQSIKHGIQLETQSLKQQLDSKQKDYQQRVDKLKENLAQLTQERNLQEEKVSKINAQTYEIKEELTVSKSRINQLQRDMKYLQSSSEIELKEKVKIIEKLQTKVQNLDLNSKFFDQQKEKLLKTVRQLKSQTHSLQSQIQIIQGKQRKTVRRVVELIESRFVSIRKEGESIREYIKILQKSYSAQLLRLSHGISLRIEADRKLSELEMEQSLREQKQSLKLDHDRVLEQIRWKYNQEMTDIRSLHCKEIKQIQYKIERAQKDANCSQKQNKNLQNEISLYQSQRLTWQKAVKNTQDQIQVEKENHKNKIESLVKQYSEQKNQLLAINHNKQEQLEQKIRDLCEIVKNVKRQLERANREAQQEKIETEGVIMRLKKQLEFYDRLKEEQKRLDESYRKASVRCKEVQERCETLQYNNQKLIGQLEKIKNVVERTRQQNEDLHRQMQQLEIEKQQLVCQRVKADTHLRDLRRSSATKGKNQEIKVLQQLDVETKQLTDKVNELKKINYFLNQKTPLRC